MGNLFSGTAWIGWILMLIIIILSVVVTIAQQKVKPLSVIPKAIIFILIGAIFAGGGYYNDWFFGADEKQAWGVMTYFAMMSSGYLLFMAAFGINFKELKEYGTSAIMMGILPCFFEGIIIGSLLLPFVSDAGPTTTFENSWAFSYCTGFAIAAATPGIIIPMLSKFIKEGYGRHHKLNEIVIIGAALDDVTALIMFIIFFSIGSTGGKIDGVMFAQIPVHLIISMIIGVFFAFVFSFGSKKVRNWKGEQAKLGKILTISFLFLSVFACIELALWTQTKDVQDATKHWVEVDFFVLLLAYGLACSYWMKNEKISNEEVEVNKTMTMSLVTYWALIGSGIVFVNAGSPFVWGALGQWQTYVMIPMILFALVVGRYIGATISLYNKEKFAWNDRVFATMAFFPKGTSTAACIGYILSKVSQIEDPEIGRILSDEIIPNIILPAALGAILVTIPIGEFVVSKTNHRLQRKTKPGEEKPKIKFKEAFDWKNK